uniref:Col_cuticle_N domain-containing protein n=1 Tax=Steinernema glaseri TaxID=37863 RepID=A0A1I7YLG6_9BILA
MFHKAPEFSEEFRRALTGNLSALRIVLHACRYSIPFVVMSEKNSKIKKILKKVVIGAGVGLLAGGAIAVSVPLAVTAMGSIRASLKHLGGEEQVSRGEKKEVDREEKAFVEEEGKK